MSLFVNPAYSLQRYAGPLVEEGDEYPCTILQWEPGHEMTHRQTTRAAEMEAIQPASLTIIIAPPDTYTGELLAGLRTLVHKYSIPGAFLEEKCQNVLNSFGHVKQNEHSTYTWLHFLLKKIEHEEDFGPPRDKNSRNVLQRLRVLIDKASSKSGSAHNPPGRRIPFKHMDGESDKNWSIGAYVLVADSAASGLATPLSHARRFSAGEKPEQDWGEKVPPNFLGQRKQSNVTLICFGPPPQLIAQLKLLPDMLDMAQVMEHPYVLWELVMYNLSVALDNEMTGLIEVFGTEQRDLGYLTGRPLKPLHDIEFSGLHLLVDHMILLLEGASGLLATIDGIIEHHDIELLHNPTFVAKKTRDALRYRRRFIQSIVERGTTFDKRIDNMISLFFSHVSLQDSGILMKDSSSLRSIALLTLVFLPVTTVATIFGAEFVYLTEDGNGSHLNLHPTGWKVLTGSAIGTCLLILAWFFHLGWLEKRFARGRMASPSINSGIIQD